MAFICLKYRNQYYWMTTEEAIAVQNATIYKFQAQKSRTQVRLFLLNIAIKLQR